VGIRYYLWLPASPWAARATGVILDAVQPLPASTPNTPFLVPRIHASAGCRASRPGLHPPAFLPACTPHCRRQPHPPPRAPFLKPLPHVRRLPAPLFSTDLAIDLGTANTLIYVRDKGIVLDEPSVVAIRHEGGPQGKKTIQAVGKEAKAMLGKVPGNIEAIRPMKDGVIADFTVTEQMLKQFIKMVHPRSVLRPSPRIIICVPCGSTQVERRAIRESALGAGASDVYLIEEPMAAAIGAGLPVSEASGSMVVDIGGGTTEVGRHQPGRHGLQGQHPGRRRQVRRSHHQLHPPQLRHADRRAHGGDDQEDHRQRLPGSEVKEMEVKGRNLSEGVPRSFTISSNEILEALTDPLNQMVSAVKNALEHTPPELGADIAERGMMLTGGGALLRDLDRLLAEETGLPVLVAEDPLTCVVRGCGMALERMERLGSIFTSE
jgi:rod shape-determining protein MreB